MSIVARNRILTIGLVALLYAGLYLAETHLDSYKLRILNLIAINAILAVSLNLIYGFGGMFSLGHSGFMAIGAYTSALLVMSPAQKEMSWLLQDIVWPLSVIQTPFWLSLVVGGLAAAFFGFLIAVPVLRLGGDYLGIATLGFAEIIRVLIVNWASITNGSLGIKGIPPHASLFVNYTCLLVCLFCIIRLIWSNFGNVIMAIRDDEVAARVMGVDTFRYRVIAFCVGAFFAGIGGALMGNLITTIDPKMFTFLLTYNILMIVVAGGLGSITGSIIGSVILTIMLEWLRFADAAFQIGGITINGMPGMRMVIFSLFLLFIILFRRRGIMGNRELSWNLLFGRGKEAKQ